MSAYESGGPPLIAQLADEIEATARRIAREEIASLAGKALRRTQDQQATRSPDHNMMVEIANREAAQFWGEVLAEYGEEEPIAEASPR